MSISHELLAHVDTNDVEIGAVQRGEIHRLNLLHRAVHVYLITPDRKLHLQLRSLDKDTHPGKWECVGGHLGPGEDYLSAAYREVTEELGVTLVSPTPLLKLKPCVETGWEFIQVYIGTYQGELAPDPTEISSTLKVPGQQIAEWIGYAPQVFTPSMLLSFPAALHYATEASNAWRIR